MTSSDFLANLIQHCSVKWDITKFNHLPKGYWDDISNQQQFMNELGKRLHLSSLDDWYKVTGTVIQKQGGSYLLSKYEDSPYKLLKSIYPQYPSHCPFFDS